MAILGSSVLARKDARPVSQSPLNLAVSTRIAGGLVAAVVLAGCGAGQITQTSTQVSAVDGASGTIGQIAVRDASIVFDPSDTAAIHRVGGDAPLQLSIINFGATADKLMSASSPVAASVTIGGNPTISNGHALIVEGGSGTAAAGASPTVAPVDGSTPTSGKATNAASAAPSAAITAVPTPDAQGDTAAQIVLTGLKEDIRSGLSYPVVFTFERAGAVTVQVPVASPTAPRTDAPAP